MEATEIQNYIIENAVVTINPVNRGNLYATAIIKVPDVFTIKNFTISKSDYLNNNLNEKIWIQPPSYKDVGGKYQKLFFLENKDFWSEIEKIIYRSYLAKIS